METTLKKNKQTGISLPFMNDEEYFKERLEKQLQFYNDQATKNKYKYKYYKRIEFILAASIPVLIGLSAYFDGISLFFIKSTIFSVATILQIIAALSGIILAFTNKIIELDEYYKNWKEYRLTHELLYNQKILYLTKCEPYTSENAFKLLIKNVEALLSKEVQKWSIQKTDNTKLTENALANIEKIFSKVSDSNIVENTVSLETKTTEEIINNEVVKTTEETIVTETETTDKASDIKDDDVVVG
jgi:hypothetical protein